MGGQLSVEMRLKSIIPKLGYEMHKGSCGKIAVIGGSIEYTGAPYFSAMSALRVGCDIAHVFCHENAATAIKSYSPEVIVHPFFKEEYNTNDLLKWLDSIQVIVVGPGLGRDEPILNATLEVLRQVLTKDITLIFDADGLFLINSNIELIKGKKNVILTPNVIEFRRLCEALNVPQNTSCAKVSQLLGGVTIIQKGQVDIISDGTYTINCKHAGSPRRCGGQGDVLSGSIAAFAAWGYLNKEKVEHDLICCAVAGCALVKECNNYVFQIKHRGMIANDMVEALPEVFEQLFNKGDIRLSYE